MHDQPPPETDLEALVAACIEAEAGGDAAGVERLLAERPELRAAARAQLADLRRSGLLDEQPEQIGNYRVIARLGRGGMGTVYLAEQLEPVQRRVALKLVRPGLQTRDLFERFALERQSLAMMQHPNIAGVFDAGITADGCPYFVMEYVDGLPITDHADLHRLTTEARVRLFQQACEGVQHAHLRGIIHRDLKPSNILVAVVDGRPVPKIIDFGIAKAIDQRLSSTPLRTEQGALLGTPEYMSPEQADRGRQDIDLRTDVYSLGIVLYELLTGALPFDSGELRAAGLLEMQRKIKEDEPDRPSTRITRLGARAEPPARARHTTAGALARTLRGELDWIVLKAIEKQPARRYDSASGLAQDLGRHLAHEPVVAGPPGAAYRLRKLLRKHRGAALASAVVLATSIAGAAIAISFATRLAGKVSEFDQLAGMVQYERAVAAEQRLHPPWPHQIEAMERWLREDCGTLLAMRPEIERTVANLRARALPQADAERQRQRETHPRFAEWRRAEQRLASLHRAQSIRAGAPLVVPDLSVEQRALAATTLNMLAWDRVAPKAEERKVYGEEAFALGCARTAVAKASDTERCQCLDTLAWALLANGQDDEARMQSALALAAAPPAQRAGYAGMQRELVAASTNAAKILAEAEAEYRSLEAELATRRDWRFAAGDGSARFLHDTLVELLDRLARLESTEMVAVEQRRAWALRIGELTRSHPNARVTWDAARAAIAASARYAGQHIELRDEDVIGLVPIGENPVTGLQEFYELRSAWDGTSDPASLPIPRHQPDGTTEVTGDTGIVFVLLPGGTFTMGAQHTRADLPHYDPVADDDESPVHDVTLAPFFLARHELTRGQWRRLSAGETPSWHRLGLTYDGNPEPVGDAHPVEQVDWTQSDRLLRRHGLVLPTEAQWEYGCRAGTGTPWWPGPTASDLADCANLLDETGVRWQPAWGRQEGDFDDGRVAPGPVGSYRANAFGLFDTHGNVWEWCLDEYGSYAGAVRAGDGLRLQGDGSANRVYRSGGFNAPASRARSSSRYMHAAAFNVSNLGLRPARAIRP